MNAKNLPDKVRLFTLNGATRDIAPGIVLVGSVKVQITFTTFDEQPSPPQETIVWLGVQASDHAGYTSFDLRPLKKFFAVVDRIDELNQKISIQSDVTEINVESPFISDFKHNVLPYLFEVEGIIHALNDKLPLSIPILVPSDINYLSNPLLKGIQSIYNPDVLDWKVSPESFGMAGLPAIGEDGCETLLPSQSTDRVFRFYQLVRLPAVSPDVINSQEGQLLIKKGKLLEYEMLWHPINHGLGQVQYSLTLAPGEGTKIAVIEWNREDVSARNERTGLNESLLHEQKRNRIVDEAVEATIKEYQRGKSFLGGTAGVGGYGGQGQGSMWGVTGSHSLGVADTSSEGNRNLESQSVQQLADTVSQASSMLRDMRSTVIVQANQSEKELLQTRSIRNFNHSHALTILYYEVVRHYCITTKATREQDVVLIKFENTVFTTEKVSKFRKTIRENLIEPTHDATFNKLDDDNLEILSSINFLTQGVIRAFYVTITDDGDEFGNRERLALHIIDSAASEPLRLSFPGGKIPHNATIMTVVNNTNTNLRYSNIMQVGLSYSVEGDGELRERGALNYLNVKVSIDFEGVSRLYDLLEVRQYFKYEQSTEWWHTPNQKSDSRTLVAEERQRNRALNLLLEHLNDNRTYYNSLIQIYENNDEKLIKFANYAYSYKSQDGTLADFINPQPIDILGDFIVFRIGDFVNIPEIDVPVAEKIVSVPTRGLFAEAQLSHCNASEIIDDTRFWDWQISPIPDEAPEISGVSPTSRYRDIIGNPTGLPNQGVGIQNPTEAPNPSALSQIIDSITKSDIFRDMTAKAELASILNELTKAAADVEKQRMQSLTELGKQDAETERARMQAQSNQRQGSSNESPTSSSGNGSGNGTDTTTSPTPITQSGNSGNEVPPARDISTDIAAIRREITDPQAQQERVERVLDRRTGTGSSSRRITIDLKYGTQDLAGQFSVTCTNRSTSRGNDTDEINNRREDTPTHSSSLTVRIPSSWSTIRVAVRIQSLMFLNHSLLDANADFRTLIQTRSTSGSIFNLNTPDSGNRLYEYVTYPSGQPHLEKGLNLA